MEKQWIMVIGSGAASFRGYILEALHDHGFSIFLVNEGEPTWEKQYIKKWLVMPLDEEIVNNQIKSISEIIELYDIKGILTYVELYVELTAKISELLGLNFYPLAIAKLARDKYEMRKCLQEKGLLVPNYKKCKLDLEESINEIGIPCVLKPVKGYSSVNVIKVESNSDRHKLQKILNDENNLQRWSIEQEYIIEEYIEGQEVSVESIVSQGQITHVAITDKFKGEEPYFEEIAHILPSKLSSDSVDIIFETASHGIKALGLNNCAVHTEIKLNKKGPYIIEIGGRLGGDKIPYLSKLALGIDMGVYAGKASLKMECSPKPSIHKYAGIAFFVPSHKQTIEKVPNGTPPIKEVVEFRFWSKEGEEIMPPPDSFFTRLGFVIVLSDSYAQCTKLLSEVIKWVEYETKLLLSNPFNSI